MHTHIFIIFYFHLFFYYFFGAGPSSAHMGWAGPSQPGPVTGPSQWPVWAEQHACANPRVLLHCASELKFTCTVQKTLINWNNVREKKRLLTWSVEVMKMMVKLWLADTTSSPPFLLLLSFASVLTVCFRFPAAFLDDEGIKKMKNAGWIYFDWFLGCSFSAVPPFFFPSLLCNLPFWFFFSRSLSLFSLFFSFFPPLSPSVLPFFLFRVRGLSLAFIEPENAMRSPLNNEATDRLQE